MKRLRKIISRLKKKAEWQHIDIMDPDLIDILTDAMINNYAVQIDYEGSGWRDIQPYGWNMSKDQNALLMVYKDTGEIRSYRLDRINDIYIDKDTQIATNDNEQKMEDEELRIYEDLMNEQYDNDIPELPDENNTLEQGIYDKQLDYLNNNDSFIDTYTQNDNSDFQNNIDNINNEQNINDIQNINSEENENEQL